MHLWALWCGNTTPMRVIRVYVGLVWSITTIYGSQNPDLRKKTRSCLRRLARVRGLSPAAALTLATRAPTLLNINTRGANVKTC